MIQVASPAIAAAGPMDAPARSIAARLFLIVASVVAAGAVAALYGVNDYSSATGELVASGRRDSQRFENVYTDAAESRLAALRMGIDLIVANPAIAGAFARDDHPALMSLVVPMFNDVLKPRYGTNQFNFWTPPAKLYLRAVDPKEFGTDGSAARRSIVLATERRSAIAGMETGLGGRLGIRAIAPVFDGTRLVGVAELGDDLVAILRLARASTGVEFAAGLDRKRSDEVERIPNKASDAFQGTDVFFEYSSEPTAQLVHAVTFNARDPAGELIQVGRRSVFVRPFAINNFSGAPTVVVATVFNLSQQFAAARQSAMLKSGGLFLVLALSTIVGLLQFQKVQRGFSRVVFGERRKLQQTTMALEAAQRRLRDVDLVKQGFFTNLVAAVSEPLQAVYGQLQVSIPEIQAAMQPQTALPVAGAAEDGPLPRLVFSMAEIGRLSKLLADYRKVELFRQKLVMDPGATTSLAEIVGGMLDAELSRFRRLPQLVITASVPATLPPVRASAELLRYALLGLVGYAAENAGVGTIVITGSVDESGWVRLAITGSAFAATGAPLDALLEDSRQFIVRLRGAARPDDANGTMMALVLARTIVESAGGKLDSTVGGSAGPGFVILLPASV